MTPRCIAYPIFFEITIYFSQKECEANLTKNAMNKYVKRYLIDAMSGMAQGLFSSLLIGTIIKTLGQQLLHLGENPIFKFLGDAGNFATDAHVVGAAMAIGIGFAMNVPALVLFSLAAVGSAANVTGGAGGPLAVLLIAIIRITIRFSLSCNRSNNYICMSYFICNSCCYYFSWCLAYCFDCKIYWCCRKFGW